VVGKYSDSSIEIDSTLCPDKRPKVTLRRHTSAMVPNFVERVGLARTGGKQAILKRADHRFMERIEFVSHKEVPPFLRLS
jgi:hypothetical protein